MTLVPLLLVIAAAFIHATWNLLSKRAAAAGAAFVFASTVVACVTYLPWVGWLLVHNDLVWSLPVATQPGAWEANPPRSGLVRCLHS